MKLWDSKRADEITGGKSSEPWYCSGISIDTRTLEKGDLFVALVGEERDGHGFLQDAAYKGAAAALVSEAKGAPLPILNVFNTLKSLEKTWNLCTRSLFCSSYCCYRKCRKNKYKRYVVHSI